MADRIIRVNMKTLEITEEGVPSRWAGFGGRAMTSAIVAEEVPPTCTPLGRSNKLVFAPGLLGGSAAPTSGRISLGAKSPLTGGIKESNSGGQAGQVLGRLGIRALIVEDKPEDKTKRYLLEIRKGGVTVVECAELAGLGNYDTVAKLVGRYGEKKSAFMSIGMAGEWGMTAASVAVTDRELRPTRHAGRGGLGAVMGSKGLKAIYCDDSEVSIRKPVDKAAFKAAGRRLAKALAEHPVTGEGLPTYGTNVLQNVLNEAGGLPTRNFREGSFAGADKISGETQRDTILARGGKVRHGCHSGCTIQCSRIYMDANGEYLTKGPEYETIWSHGTNCCIDDLDAIARMDRMDDDIGVDTIEMGATIGVAMEAGLAAFGDAAGAIELLEQVQQGTPLGRILGCGAKVTGQCFGVDHVPVVKGQAMPAYDPRAVQGIGVTYATSTMGADHTAGYTIAPNILKVGGFVDPLKPDGQVDISRGLQIATAALDSTGMCLFVAFAILDNSDTLPAITDLINALYGLELTLDDVTSLGQTVLSMERKFNQAAGFTAADDRLPDWMRTEPLAPHNTVFTVPEEDLDQVFNFVE
ncbi:MAG: aldehyde ferredoxin oxidoreductase [Lentisphaerae bacterium]|jgi:aldehyde:ferredoxin oxidoreductase|nr:aldehyde ferredoxin oxidoreductase [Lentisphaerota bacterium]MBT4820903.1 aldehyde ferredoxin oxidoreductase [Lentisphaerota bacterium]MBT5605055.1 aldehyde ferredoxin oxidoreductase [Lentisphaerota bacterium]MBT7058677.1 aldehyde ferredoxin oxidoreductase [Lentisphaerota bacterium]MBT7847018.1 aldehyde ferredoxin oxidoreductase [Lentisphaerota bacterium]